MKHPAIIILLALAILVPFSGNSRSMAFAQSAKAALKPITAENLAPLYFDLLDFMRTQSLGRNFRTPDSERQRVSDMVASSWWQMDNATQSKLVAMAELGQTIGGTFAAMTDAQKQEELREWRKIVLSPLWFYAPLQSASSYRNQGFSFSFPGLWHYAEGQSYMFLGPSIAYTWEQVNLADSSPPGVLMAAFANNTSGTSYLDVARLAASSYVNGMQELCAFGSEVGAIVILNGKFPNQTEEKFFWLVLVPSGNLLVLARMGGPVSQADTLVPAFYTIVNSMTWNTGSSGGGGYAPGETSRAFDTAWSRVSTAIVSNIWAK
jgi:hypothetical protein